MYRRSGKEKESPCLVFSFFAKREILTLSSYNDGKEMCQKSVMHVIYNSYMYLLHSVSS